MKKTILGIISLIVITIFLTGCQNLAGKAYPSGLPMPVAYWNFDEGIGSFAGDSVGSNGGTISGATWSTDCISGP